MIRMSVLFALRQSITTAWHLVTTGLAMSARCVCERCTKRRLARIVARNRQLLSSRTTQKSALKTTRQRTSSGMIRTWESATRSKKSLKTPLFCCATTARIRAAMLLAWVGPTSTVTFAQYIRRSCVIFALGIRRSLHTSISSSHSRSCASTRSTATTHLALLSRPVSKGTQSVVSADNDSTDETSCTRTAATGTSAAICVTE